MIESWEPVRDWVGIYEVSNRGVVRSLDRPGRPGRVLKPQKSKQGHLSVVLSDSPRKAKKLVHRLVAEAFIPNPDECPMVLHWDDDPGNNESGNLRWGTRSDNGLDAVRNGRHSNSNKLKCPQGHEFTTENTYIRSDTGARRCRICTLEGNSSPKRKG